MKQKIIIVAIGGSLEEKSSTLAVMKFVTDELISLGAEVKIIDVKKIKLPLYSNSIDQKKAGKGFQKILDAIHSANGYIFASPEYHGTVSAAFKNIIDYLEFLSGYNPPYLTGKPVACIAAAGSENSGSATVQTMINIVHSLRGIAASGSIAVGSSNKHVSKNGLIKNEALKRKLKRLAREIYDLAVRLK